MARGMEGSTSLAYLGKFVNLQSQSKSIQISLIIYGY